MKFISDTPDKKNILKNETDINKFLLENNVDKIEKIIDFFQSPGRLMLLNGFLGTGKTFIVNHALSFLNEDTVILKYNCFETTVLEDILLEFFDTFKKLTAENIINTPKTKTENFTQKINSYFQIINKPLVIIINSFEQVLKDNKADIINFIEHLVKTKCIKIIIIGRKFNYEDFSVIYERVSISALCKPVFEKFLKANDIKQIGPLSDELYKYTRGYYFYTALSVKMMKIATLTLSQFLSEYTKSFQTFNDFILRAALSTVDPVSGHLFRFLTLMRHPVNIKLLKTIHLLDEDKLSFFTENLILNKDGNLVYLQDYYKIIAENSIAENIAVKIHKSCVELYNTQLPLKPLERDLLISRHTMRQEIEYHNLYLPKRPSVPQKPLPATEFATLNNFPEKLQETIQQKDEKIQTISFVFETEAQETAILNKIANSINSFIDIEDKKLKDFEEIKKLSLVELLNLAKKEEQNFDYKKIVMIYQKALTLTDDEDYYTLLPAIYTKISNAFEKLSDWFSALKYYELALEFFNSTGDIEKFNECKFNIANIYFITFKTDKAKNILNEILNENISANLKIKSKLLLSNIEECNLKDVLELVSSDTEKPVAAELYFKYALSLDEKDDLQNAIKYYKKCIDTERNPNINTWLSSAFTNIAGIYEDAGKIDGAVKYLKESLRLDELTKNQNGIYISSKKLAEIYSKTNDDKAMEYLLKAKSCALELNENFYIVSVEIALGDFYNRKKQFSEALNAYTNAKKLASNNFKKDNIKKIEMRITDLKMRLGEYK